MKLLVTGGAGFIGSNFIRFILSKYPQDEIINFDKLTYAGNLENLKDIEGDLRYKFFKGDICDPQAVEKALGLVDQVDAIVNFAAESHVDRSILAAGDFVRTDVFGTYVLLEAVKKFKIKRYLHISTDEVYGSIDQGSFTEESTLKPNSPYSASKAGGDLLVRSYFKTHGLPVLITRSSNNYGPYQYPEKIIPLFITNALQKQQLPLYGDGKNVRDWLYVVDNCEAVDLVLRQGKLGEVYNIGGESERQNIEVTKIILKELGLSEELIKYVDDRLGHDRRYSIDCSKVKKLGWQPKTVFEQGLIETVRWYQANRQWWEKLKTK
ncbi:dTDP-glucose 4,6-dehydratase [candidate division WOR-1 bacterium RIFOXYB2_FULL_42_35]|uniref:dTDP-glucose 4,6-dehydratase n=1 Tax=candidate division WOR-1 bacterium RIFOXYC2_FULL_41_25 TaxID=1802586 RepID=A0A1F4TKI6_UNCSA|nr:MAG: dTDP-glucose 4,6-dehydratase [candidate division WOR-1 bacterium RIFOXYA2_FULL_41_14]OGC22500.1 MAG: dTDP-glucose 4,6-dehydratase [candidate division WOR-1 bacterium RIFOXYB2_FULL_42_35]OGC33238.1 MAG: dTDP-glucose 4,6-dehydratase [candidate division WOR-1 bacterium RIFOXYC2_FULL_41_25]